MSNIVKVTPKEDDKNSTTSQREDSRSQSREEEDVNTSLSSCHEEYSSLSSVVRAQVEGKNNHKDVDKDDATSRNLIAGNDSETADHSWQSLGDTCNKFYRKRSTSKEREDGEIDSSSSDSETSRSTPSLSKKSSSSIRDELDSRGPGSVRATKNTLKNIKAIEGGLGKYLLMKMGWVEGTGLGKNRQGSLDPVFPSVKLNTRGLIAEGEIVRDLALQIANQTGQPDSHCYPIATLLTYCQKQKYPPPQFELMHESGPPHKKLFSMRVLVNGIYYHPTSKSSNKKMAKHLAAAVALQAIGLLPKGPSKLKLSVEMPSDF